MYMKQATKTCSKKKKIYICYVVYIKHETQYIIIWPFMGIIHNVERQPKIVTATFYLLGHKKKELQHTTFNIQQQKTTTKNILNIDFISHHKKGNL